MARAGIFGNMKKSVLRSTLVKVSVGALIAVSVILIIYFSSATTVFLNNIESNTKDLAAAVSNARAEEVNAIISGKLSDYISGVSALSHATSMVDANKILIDYLDELRSAEPTDGIVTARYFKSGLEYYVQSTIENVPYTQDESASVKTLAASGLTGCTGSVYEANYRADKCMAFIIQTPECQWMDCVAFFVRMDVMFAGLSAFSDTERQNYELVCLAAGGGSIIKQQMTGEVFADIRTTNNLITMLNEASNDKETVNRLEQSVNRGMTGSELVKINGESYAVAFSPINIDSGRLYIAEVYNPDVIFRGSYQFIAKLGGAVVMLGVIFTIMFALITAIRGYYKRQLYKSDNIDPIVGCRSFKKFSIDAEDLIGINRTAAYAMIYITVENYSYIKTTYGEETAADTLRYIGNILDKFVGGNETYAYISDNKFSALIRFNVPDDIVNRIKIINALAYNFPELKKDNYNIRLRYGIYPINRMDSVNIQPILEKAMLAHRMKPSTDNRVYAFYDESMGEREERERAMEGRMDVSLKTGDFKVFFQPKLNIKYDRLEGAEALVRWYYPKDNSYILPGDFIHLFETNGFIAKLDRYVYEEVCIYLSRAVEQGQRVVPVSVNVSRVTAMQDDFVAFYVSTKKKYHIADGYIMIEFTESFAQESYEALRVIILQLRSNGFKCSIDDFGSGYASYSILKELPMDELKLDQFFIKPGVDPKKDDTLLQSIIKLAVDLGMKITQEGVETWNEIERLKKLGCTVIQGFYYSKPITMYDYMDFVESHTQKHPEI